MIQTIIEILQKEPALEGVSPEDIDQLSQKIMNSISNDFLKKQLAEINRINLEKWDEGIRKNRDPGDEFVLEWIKNNGREFHEKFQYSDCRVCTEVFKCSIAPKNDCDEFIPELFEQSRYLVLKLIRLLEEGKFLTTQSKEFIRGFCKHHGMSDEDINMTDTIKT